MMKFPYGIADFRKIRLESYFYCDRTDKIPLLEAVSTQLFIGSSGLSVLLANPHYGRACGDIVYLLLDWHTWVLMFSPFPPFEKGKGEETQGNNYMN